MELNNFIHILKELYTIKLDKDTYMESVPTDLRSVFIDNKYIDLSDSATTIVLETLIPEILLKELNWFLYDWRPGYCIYAGNCNYTINSIQDMIKYIEEEYSGLDN